MYENPQLISANAVITQAVDQNFEDVMSERLDLLSMLAATLNEEIFEVQKQIREAMDHVGYLTRTREELLTDADASFKIVVDDEEHPDYQKHEEALSLCLYQMLCQNAPERLSGDIHDRFQKGNGREVAQANLKNDFGDGFLDEVNAL